MLQITLCSVYALSWISIPPSQYQMSSYLIFYILDNWLENEVLPFSQQSHNWYMYRMHRKKERRKERSTVPSKKRHVADTAWASHSSFTCTCVLFLFFSFWLLFFSLVYLWDSLQHMPATYTVPANTKHRTAISPSPLLTAHGSWLDGDFECRTAVHLIQCLLEIYKLEHICYHTLDTNLAAVEVGNRTWEAERLREWTDDLLFI